VGREARCSARWGARSGEVKALLESTELVVRGAFRAGALLAELRDVRAEGDTLRFSVRHRTRDAARTRADRPQGSVRLAGAHRAQVRAGAEELTLTAEDDAPSGGKRGRVERHGEVRLLVRGIARGVSSDEIAELFAPFGVDRERIALPRDRRTRRRKGMAYIVVPSAQHAADAIKALNATMLQDKAITIEAAAERPPKRPRRFNGPPRRF
jgi:hypothetical protein